MDRTGDTFRWKGENVATNDVCNVLQAHAAVREANVYGVLVPGCEGKAGMASLSLAAPEDAATLASLQEHVARELPPYARPLFLRTRRVEVRRVAPLPSRHRAVQTRVRQHAKTSTFKFQKHQASQEGFDPARCAPDRVYVLRAGAYAPLDSYLYSEIAGGRVRL